MNLEKFIPEGDQNRPNNKLGKEISVVGSKDEHHFSIGVGDKIYQQYKEFKYVELFYDQNKERIGIKPVSKETRASHKVRKNNSSAKYFSCTDFLQKVGASKGRYEAHIREDGMIVANINKDNQEERIDLLLNES